RRMPEAPCQGIASCLWHAIGPASPSLDRARAVLQDARRAGVPTCNLCEWSRKFQRLYLYWVRPSPAPRSLPFAQMQAPAVREAKRLIPALVVSSKSSRLIVAVRSEF